MNGNVFYYVHEFLINNFALNNIKREKNLEKQNIEIFMFLLWIKNFKIDPGIISYKNRKILFDAIKKYTENKNIKIKKFEDLFFAQELEKYKNAFSKEVLQEILIEYAKINKKEYINFLTNALLEKDCFKMIYELKDYKLSNDEIDLIIKNIKKTPSKMECTNKWLHKDDSFLMANMNNIGKIAELFDALSLNKRNKEIINFIKSNHFFKVANLKDNLENKLQELPIFPEEKQNKRQNKI